MFGFKLEKKTTKSFNSIVSFVECIHLYLRWDKALVIDKSFKVIQHYNYKEMENFRFPQDTLYKCSMRLQREISLHIQKETIVRLPLFPS